MTNIDELAEDQLRLGKEFKVVFENFKKEPLDRRTLEKTKVHQAALEAWWTTVEENHTALEELKDEHADHGYFKQALYKQLYAIYQTFSGAIKVRLAAAGKKSSDWNLFPEQDGEDSQAPFKDDDQEQQGRIRLQTSTMKSLEHLLTSIEAMAGKQLTKAYLQTKLKTIKEYWTDISSLHKRIMSHPNQYGYTTTEYAEMEDHYQMVTITLEEQLEAYISQPGSANQPSNVKLPKITLPTFDGSYTKWKQFQDLFVQLIGSQPIGGAQKLFYLKANLTGEPSRLIRHLQASDDNYKIAWQILVDRYDNKRALLSALLNELLSQPTLAVESSTGVKRLHDTTKECLLAIGNLDIQTDQWDPLMLHLLLQKVDKESRRQYEQSLPRPQEVQSMQHFFKFLDTRFHQLETVSSKDERRKTSSFVTSTPEFSCYVCKANGHRIFDCARFLRLRPTERLQTVKRLQLCINCLRSNHTARDCNSSSCFKCNARHNTLLHDTQQQQGPRSTASSSSRQPSSAAAAAPTSRGTASASRSSNTVSRSNQSANNEIIRPSSSSSQTGPAQNQQSTPAPSSLNAMVGSQVMLATAVIEVINASGTRVPCRALLDSGSQINIISERMVNELGLKRTRISVPVSGVGGAETVAKHKTSITIQSRVNNFSANISAVILPRISDMQPTQHIQTSTWKLPANIELADPSFFKPQPIDILLGAELYLDLLEAERIKIDEHLPILQNTQLGWIVSGKVSTNSSTRYHCHIASQPSMGALEQQIQRFWEIEHHDAATKRVTKEQADCEDYYQQTFRRLPTGQFVVRLPFREDASRLGSSIEMATKRFFALERRLNRNPELKDEYQKFIHEYKDLNHMQLVKPEQIAASHYFLPHHCVIKPDSSTTKLRVVFDGSAKTTSGVSLNEILSVGATVQPDLFSIIIRFRTREYVLTADISKMYRQIKIDNMDQNYQLIIWRDNEDEPLQYYQLNTVTYGTSPAPFLATRSINQLAMEEAESFPLAAGALLEDTYVDDILAGADTLEKVTELKDQLINLLRKGQFELRKFCANHPDIIQDIPEEHREKRLIINDTEAVKTLGIVWQPQQDVFQCYATIEDTGKFSKRTALSDIARLFDPIGLIGPVIVLGKLFVQELWRSNLQWDEDMPPQMKERWIRFRTQLEDIKLVKIPRKVLVSTPTEIQLHAFSDSSTLAYGTCCYLRSVDKYGQIMVRLLCSKSRIAPLKSTTIARLELCGALLMAELVERLQQCLSISISKICYYTDSTTTLSWIASPSYSWTTFVANRVAKIQELTRSEQWRHIEGTQNPADLVSRGLLPQALAQSTLWFNGPTFLQESEDKWPSGTFKTTSDTPESRPRKLAFTATIPETKYVDLLNSVSHRDSFCKLQRIFGYCIRFINNCKLPKALRTKGNLTINELDLALYSIVKNVQRTSFYKEYILLKKEKPLEGSNSIISLDPFLDNTTGIIRIGGRLRHSELQQEAKHQMLLPKDHFFTECLVRHLHQQHMHAAQQTLIAIIRQRFWPLNAKGIARKVIYKCIRCFKCKPRSIDQLMGNLPRERVQPSRPFHTTGVDFCGPVKIHYRIRGKTPTKAYIAVFVCFATKAVHLEVVSDLTSEAFINALKRFISRRGLCHTIFCDNATNFVGAKSQLRELKDTFAAEAAQTLIGETCQQNHIQWKPIPPRSPHFGGLWEAAVKSAKYHMIRQIGNANVTFEELHTIVVQIEAILNSRPITAMSSDPNDLEALTPGHFLIGSPLTAFAEPDTSNKNMDQLTRFQRIRHIQQNFWKRWSSEYLHQLQSRPKWQRTKPNITPGTMVLLKEQNMPPLKWPLGRVIETTEGSDKRTRVVTVKTASNLLKRAVHNVCPLPIEAPQPEATDQANDDATEEPNEGQRNASKPADNMDNHSIRAPRRHLRSNAVLSLMMITTLIFPSLGNMIEINPFNNYPGIYYENIGELGLIQTNWNLIVYYNLTNYWNELEELDRCIKQITQLCGYLSEDPKYSCTTISTQFQHQLEVLQYYNNLLRNNHEDVRHKRSPFDIIGTIGNKLFGILDAEYATTMEQTIDDIKSNEENLKGLIAKQTSVIESTINIIKKDEVLVNKQFEMIERVINRLLEDYKAAHRQFEQAEFLQLFNSLSLHASLIIISYQRTQNALLELMLDLHHGKVSPLLLTPTQIKRELQLIREYLPASTMIPMQPGGNEYSNLYKQLTARGRIMENKAVFEIKIPLLTNEQFEIYQMIALPIPGDNSQQFIELSARYLGVNLHRDKFLTLSEMDFSQCKEFNNGRYLCQERQPLMTRAMIKDKCEISLFHATLDTIPINCQVRTYNLTEWWQQLYHKNMWIYWLPTKSTITAVCGTTTNQLTLQGQGLLQSNSDCTLKHNLLTFSTRKQHTNIIRSSYTPSVNMSLHLRRPEQEGNATIQLNYTIDHQQEIDSLKQTIAAIKLQAETATSVRGHDIHHYSVIYICLGAILCLITYGIFRVIKKRRTPQRPTAAQRSKKTPKEDRKFEL